MELIEINVAVDDASKWLEHKVGNYVRLQDVKAEVQDLDRGEFKESGTDVATSIIYLVK